MHNGKGERGAFGNRGGSCEEKGELRTGRTDRRMAELNKRTVWCQKTTQMLSKNNPGKLSRIHHGSCFIQSDTSEFV